MPILPYNGVWPVIASDAFVAPTAVISGAVTIEAGASVWFGAVIRADHAAVRIGPRSNVQDNCVIHVDENNPCVIGADCTLGHGAIVHGATLGDRVLIGIHASVLNGATVGDDCIVAAAALVPEGKEIAAGSLAMGVPAKVMRPVNEAERTRSLDGVQHYVDLALAYRMALGEMPPMP